MPVFPMTNGTNIVGLLSTPEYTGQQRQSQSTIFSAAVISNHVVAYVRSISGPAVEKPPQDNDIVRSDSFGYRILCVNAPVAADTNTLNAWLTQLTTGSSPPTCTSCG